MTSSPEKDGTHCLICHGQVGLSSQNCVQIFEDEGEKENGKQLVETIGSLLDTEITTQNSHSQVLCIKCSKLCNEFEDLEARMMEIKEKIVTQYKDTIMKITKLENTEDGCNDHDYLDSIERHVVQKKQHENLEVGQLDVKTEKDVESNEQSDGENEQTDKNSVNGDENGKNAEEIGESDEVKDTPEIMLEEHLDEQFLQDDLITDHAAETKMTEVYLDEYNPIIKYEDGFMKVGQVSQVTKAEKISRLRANEKKEDVSQEIVSKQDDIYTCLLCSNDDPPVTGNSKEIVTHMKVTHEARLYICDMCGQSFRKRNELSIHLDDHVAKEEGDFQCEVCNRIFSNLRLFRIHRRIHYPQVKSWSCDHCGKRYSSKNLLDEHVNTHNGVRPYVCDTCGKDFASKYTFKAHTKTHEVRARPYECNQCSKTFLSQQNLTQHEKTHLGVKEFICQVCGKAFGSPHNLEVHNIVHTGYKPFTCKICGKKFARKAEIRDHERIHTGEKPYQCEFCGATFSQRSNLQSHKRATHYNDKRYKCNDCGKGFKRRRLLDYHIKAAHTGERPYKCETCSATFVYPEHFKKHMRIHTGEKPYLCEVCGKAFNSRDNRNAHRFIHSDKKPYECLVCGMGFMRKPLLYAHMQTQGHLNDTIVVNQPRLTTEESSLIMPDEDVELLMEEDADELEETEMYVTDLKDHVIIAGNDTIYEHATELELNNAEDNIQGGVQELVVDDQITFAEGGVIQCKTDQGEHVYSYNDAEEGTIVVSTGAEYKELIGDNKNPVRLVQIRIPTSGVDGKSWLSLVQQNT